MTQQTSTGIVHLTDRTPVVTGPEMLASLVPPPQFDGATFDTYRADPAYPSQEEAKTTLQRFAGRAEAVKRGGFFRRAPKEEPAKPGVYLDGGFGVGKTHLLASVYHELPARRKYFGSFIEYTALVGALGYRNTVDLLRGADLLCIDEFELDDVANTRMAVTFLRAVIAGGTKLAATSNAIPDRLGEGRFNAEDFERELLEIGSHWDVLRLDGPDYRATSRPSRSDALEPGEVEALARGAGAGRLTVDDFDAVLAHLRLVHPVQYGHLLDGLDTVVIHGLHPIENQGSALLFVQLVDELYDRGLRFGATGCAVTDLFPESYRHGGYRKKYGRCESRLGAMLGEAAS